MIFMIQFQPTCWHCAPFPLTPCSLLYKIRWMAWRYYINAKTLFLNYYFTLLTLEVIMNESIFSVNYPESFCSRSHVHYLIFCLNYTKYTRKSAEMFMGNSHNLLNVYSSKCLVYFIASLYIIKSHLDKGGMRYFTITDWSTRARHH